jgi:hypothetical protein
MRKDCVGCDSLEEDNTRLTAELEAANKKLEAYERMKVDAGSSCRCGRPWPWDDMDEVGYEAGKANGIPQGVLDGYDAGFLAGKAKLAEVQKQALEQYGCSCVQCMNLVYTPEDE